jgi:hypothetical protein
MRPGSGAAFSFYSVMTAAYRRAAVKGLGRSSAEHGVPGGGYRCGWRAGRCRRRGAARRSGRWRSAGCPGAPTGSPGGRRLCRVAPPCLAFEVARQRNTSSARAKDARASAYWTKWYWAKAMLSKVAASPRGSPRSWNKPIASRHSPVSASPAELRACLLRSVGLLRWPFGRRSRRLGLKFQEELAGKWPPGTSGPAGVHASSQSRLIASARLAERARPQRMRWGMRSALDLDSARQWRKRERECRPARPGPHHDGAFVGMRDASDDR